MRASLAPTLVGFGTVGKEHPAFAAQAKGGGAYWRARLGQPYPKRVPIELPEHVTIRRRDRRREVLLHRSMAVISDDKIEIKAARGTIILPIVGLLLACGIGWFIADRGFTLPLWVLVGLLFFSLVLVPFSVMSLISAVVGADVVVDVKKGSATWQQGYLGMGIGTKELVPFAKIHHFEITIEGDQPDRWQDQTDDLRQFALILVKRSGKRLTLAQVPVPAYGQTDGMDRTLAVGQAVAELTGSTIQLPEGWELTEIDTETGEPLKIEPEPYDEPEPEPVAPARRNRGRRH